jgi:hypothetical protein
MPTKRIDQLFKELPFDRKLVSVGAILLIISVFLPWYSDLDSFKAGYTFLGISGPLYLSGYSVLFLAGCSLAFVFFDVFKKKPAHLKMKSSSVYIACGMFALYLLVLVNSIYFHSRFGFNITLKQPQFGMYAAFLGTAFMIIGGFLSAKNKATLLQEFQDAVKEPNVMMPQGELRKPKENLFRPASNEYSVPKTEAQNVTNSSIAPKQPQQYRNDL